MENEGKVISGAFCRVILKNINTEYLGEMEHIYDIISIQQNCEDILEKRSLLSEELLIKSGNIKSKNFKSISVRDLELIFELYDRIFFENWFGSFFKGKIMYSLSKRMTRSAGLTICPKKAIKNPEELILEIRIGVNFFFRYDQLEGSKLVSGIETHNALEALLLVFEHELCHVLEFILYKKSSCKGKRFKTIALNIFGHTDSYHKLPSQKQIVHENMGLHIGDSVYFTFEGKKLNGILYNITKRATVMVKDKKGPYRDKIGNRYSKYYVPLEYLNHEN